jgi:hypothetical protein
MGQVLAPENLPDLVIASSTTITMGTTYLGKQTRLNIGGQQFLYSSAITINFATTGINGLDTGAIAANTLYYIYAVQSSNTPGLVASLAAPTTGPTGFTSWKEVARVRTFLGSAGLAAITNKTGGTSAYQSVNEWQSWTPTLSTGVRGTNTEKAFWQHSGPNICIVYDYVQTVAGTSGSGIYSFGLPNGYSYDSTKLGSGGVQALGSFYGYDGTLEYNGHMTIGASGFSILLSQTINGSNFARSTFCSFGGSASLQFRGSGTIPIAEFVGLYT